MQRYLLVINIVRDDTVANILKRMALGTVCAYDAEETAMNAAREFINLAQHVVDTGPHNSRGAFNGLVTVVDQQVLKNVGVQSQIL